MGDIKADFKQWLIEKGLSTTTKAGKQSTVYEYIRHLNLLCKKIFNSDTASEWEIIAENIYPILGFHMLCPREVMHLTEDDAQQLRFFLDSCYSATDIFQSSPKQEYFAIELYHDKSEITDHLNLISMIDKNLSEDDWLVLKINAPDSEKSKNRAALNSFYKFLSETEFVPNGVASSKHLKNKRDVRKYYDGIAKDLRQIADIQNNITKIYIAPGNILRPPLFAASYTGDNEVRVDKVCELLSLERHAVKRMSPKTSCGKVSKDDVNDFIKNNFHPAQNTSVSVPDETHWWTVEKLVKNKGIHPKKLQRLRYDGKLAYIKISSQKYLYYPHNIS